MRGEIFLAADIGGTNTRVGIFHQDARPLFLKSANTRRKHPYSVLKEAVDEAKRRKIKISGACIGAAGPIENEETALMHVKLTNAKPTISVRKLQRIIGTEKVMLINDFEAVAYGLNALRKGEAIYIAKKRIVPRRPKAIIGAGTGLGKAYLYYDGCRKYYAPLPSEEGRAPIIIRDEGELKLLSFIKKSQRKKMVCWEDIVSGQGILNAYRFLCKDMKNRGQREKEVGRQIDSAEDKARIISQNRKQDRCCEAAFDLFSRFYARFARLSAISILPYGGLYITGGIARNNPNIVRSDAFRDEWNAHDEIESIIRKIPLLLVKDDNLGMRGATFCASKNFGR